MSGVKILFIKLRHIGDALIMTPALTAARELWPQGRIDVLVRGGTEGILKGSLALDNIYTTAAPEKNRRGIRQLFKDLRLLWKLRKKKYDWVFELSDNDRGRFMAVAIGGRNLCAHAFKRFPFWALPFFNQKSRTDYSAMHRVQKDVDLLKTTAGYAGGIPLLQFDRSFSDWSWVQKHLKVPPIVIHPVTRWRRKMWPIDKWKLLVERLGQIAPIVITSGPSPEEVFTVRQIALAVPEAAMLTEGRLDWPQMAGLLYSSRLLVTLDTATMHLGAACQIPLVAIFGPGDPHEFGPWGCAGEVVTPPSSASGLPAENIIASIEVEDVWQMCQRVLAEREVKA